MSLCPFCSDYPFEFSHTEKNRGNKMKETSDLFTVLDHTNKTLSNFYHTHLVGMEQKIDSVMEDSTNEAYEDELEVIGTELANIRNSIQEIQRCIQMAKGLKR